MVQRFGFLRYLKSVLLPGIEPFQVRPFQVKRKPVLACCISPINVFTQAEYFNMERSTQMSAVKSHFTSAGQAMDSMLLRRERSTSDDMELSLFIQIGRVHPHQLFLFTDIVTHLCICSFITYFRRKSKDMALFCKQDFERR